MNVSENVAMKMLEWKDRGILRWENQEIASGHPAEVFTPADGSAGWRYKQTGVVDLATVIVDMAETIQTFRGRFKAHYWGPGVADSTKKKADRLTPNGCVWSWTYDEPGYVMVTIARLTPVSFQDWSAGKLSGETSA